MNNTCEILLVGSTDTKIISTYSTYDRYHVNLKTWHVEDVLCALDEAIRNETVIKWI